MKRVLDWLVPVGDAAPGFFHVPGQDKGKYPHSHAMLIMAGEEGNEGIMFDCGVGNRVARKLAKEVSISKVYFSHWHEDHALSWHVIKKATRYCHVNDIPALSSIDTLLDRYAVKGTGLESPFTTYMQGIGFEPVDGLHAFKDGTRIDLHDGRHVDVIHAPGHAAGHCCFLEPESGVAYLGDIDLTCFGPWYGARDCSLEDFLDSIERLSRLPIAHALTGHARVYHGAEVRDALERYAGAIEAREQRLLHLLSEKVPRTVQDLAGNSVVYKQYGAFESYLLLAEGIMIEHHLRLLEKKGRVRRDGDGHVLA